MQRVNFFGVLGSLTVVGRASSPCCWNVSLTHCASQSRMVCYVGVDSMNSRMPYLIVDEDEYPILCTCH